MKFCTHCGAELPEEAKFCRNCGAKIGPSVSARTSDDGEGIVIDAPEGATVTISDPPKATKAPDAKGEFFIASWGEPEPTKEAEQPVKKTTSDTNRPIPPFLKKTGTGTSTRTRTETSTGTSTGTGTSTRTETQRHTLEERTVNEAEAEAEEQEGLFSRIWRYAKIAIIIVALIATAVIAKGLFNDKNGDEPQPQQTESPTQDPQDPTDGDLTVTPQNVEDVTPQGNEEEDFTNRDQPSNLEKGEIIVIGEDEDGAEENKGFQKIEDMPLPERIEYMESLLERTKAELSRELAKGDAGDQSKIRELRGYVVEISKALSEIKQ